jgi:hypothetical protein
MQRALSRALLLTGFSSAVATEKIDNRDFVIDACYPTQNEIALAEARPRRFWAKHWSSYEAKPRFLDVETSKSFPGRGSRPLIKTDKP